VIHVDVHVHCVFSTCTVSTLYEALMLSAYQATAVLLIRVLCSVFSIVRGSLNAFHRHIISDNP
jgi:hypothetical protein